MKEKLKKKKLWVNNYLTFEVVVLSMNQHTCATKSKHIIKIIEKEKESILEKKNDTMDKCC